MVMNHLRNFYANKQVLVTGGAGFIGSHLVEKLVELGAHVTVFDNFSSGNLNNLAPVFSRIAVTYADVRTSHSTRKATAKKDVAFHLAALVSVTQSVQNPQLCRDINTGGTANLLDGCKENCVPTFIFSSSSAVYGNQQGPCAEDRTTEPQSPYAQSKRDSEHLCKQYAEQYNITTACLRYFNVYGERQNPNGDYAAVVAKFKHNLRNNLPLTIFGDGKQSRDFIPVADVVLANLIIGTQSNIKGEIFNIGTGASINLFDLIAKLETELQTKAAAVTFQPARSGDIYQSQAVCDKYKKLVATILN